MLILLPLEISRQAYHPHNPVSVSNAVVVALPVSVLSHLSVLSQGLEFPHKFWLLGELYEGNYF